MPARLSTRALAFAIDIVIGLILFSPAIVGLVLLVEGHPANWPWPMLLLVIGAALLTVFQFVNVRTHGLKGLTAGKVMLGLRSVSVREQRRPGFWRIVLRTILLGVSMTVPIPGPVLMFVSSLWDPLQAGRSWLDRAAGCWVINIRAGLNPQHHAAVSREHSPAGRASPRSLRLRSLCRFRSTPRPRLL